LEVNKRKVWGRQRTCLSSFSSCFQSLKKEMGSVDCFIYFQFLLIFCKLPCWPPHEVVAITPCITWLFALHLTPKNIEVLEVGSEINSHTSSLIDNFPSSTISYLWSHVENPMHKDAIQSNHHGLMTICWSCCHLQWDQTQQHTSVCHPLHPCSRFEWSWGGERPQCPNAQHSTTINDNDNDDANDTNKDNHAKITIGNDATTTIYQIWCIQQLAATSTATKGPNQYPTSDDNEFPTDNDNDDANSTAVTDYKTDNPRGRPLQHPLPQETPQCHPNMIFTPTMTMLNGCGAMLLYSDRPTHHKDW